MPGHWGGATLRKLERVALALAQERHVGAVLRMIVQGIAEEAGMALVRLWLLDGPPRGPPRPGPEAGPESTRCLHLVASAGRPRQPEEDCSRLNGSFSRVALGAGKVGVIGHSGDSVLIPELSAGQPWVLRPDWVRREALQSFAGQPLKFRDEVLGVLGLFSRARLSQSDFGWLRAFADQAAVAIVNARSFLRHGLPISTKQFQNIFDAYRFPCSGAPWKTPSGRRNTRWSPPERTTTFYAPPKASPMQAREDACPRSKQAPCRPAFFSVSPAFAPFFQRFFHRFCSR